MLRSRKFMYGLVAGVIVSLLSVVIIQSLPPSATQIYAADQAAAVLVRQQLQNQTVDLATAFQQVAVVMRPSVVSVNSVSHIGPSTGGPQQMPELPPEFRRFFGDDFPGFGDMQQQGHESRGLGSGVIVSQDGYIVTNNHVVDGADEVTVTLSDNRTLDATVIGTDADTDLAVLKVEAAGLEPAVLGNSDDMQVGEWVVAVGSPLGLNQTVTSGIVSAMGRNGVGVAQYEDFIQTDAAINPGNSGGPLVNLRGEVIGINTAIASRTGGFMGIGFAIPSSMVHKVMDDIIDDGQVTRGWLGAAVQNLDSDLAASFGYDGNEGVLIGDVVDDSPADHAGLQAGDIVVAVNGRHMDSANEMVNAIASVDPGTLVKLDIFREGREQQLEVEIGTRPNDFAKNSPRITNGTDDSVAAGELGVSVKQLTPELANQYELSESDEGVVITEVDPNGLAAKAGVRPGDVIVRIGNSAIDTVSDFRQATDELNLQDGVRLQIRSHGVQRFVFLRQ